VINKKIDFPGKNGLEDWVFVYLIAYLVPYLLLSLLIIGEFHLLKLVGLNINIPNKDTIFNSVSLFWLLFYAKKVWQLVFNRMNTKLFSESNKQMLWYSGLLLIIFIISNNSILGFSFINMLISEVILLSIFYIAFYIFKTLYKIEFIYSKEIFKKYVKSEENKDILYVIYIKYNPNQSSIEIEKQKQILKELKEQEILKQTDYQYEKINSLIQDGEIYLTKEFKN
jgi:hypothetical protein